MAIIDVVKQLINANVSVFVEDGKLKTRSDKAAMTPAIIALIKQNKFELIEYLSKASPVAHESETIQKRNVSQQCALSFNQQQLWLVDKIEQGSTHYHMPSALRLEGQLDYDVLDNVFNTLFTRHESLRTCFKENEQGQAYQFIQDVPDFQVNTLDLSKEDTTPDEKQTLINRIIKAETSKPFDLSYDLMLRVTLLVLSECEHILLLTMHHIASDGWSMGILTNEFSQLYSTYKNHSAINVVNTQGADTLPTLPIQYADYAHWQREWMQGESYAQQLAYWQKQLADLPTTHRLPLDNNRPLEQRFLGQTFSSLIKPQTSQMLKALCQQQGATLFMGLHAAFSVLLARYSHENDIVIGTPSANREQPELAGLIGFFVNTLVLRSRLSSDLTFEALIKQCQKTLQEAYAAQQVPFEQIVEVLQPERSTSYSPLFQVMLVLQNNEEGSLDLPDLTLTSVEQDSTTAKYDLTLNVHEDDQGLHLYWEYNQDLFHCSRIEKMAEHFELLLAALVTEPQSSIFDVDMLEESERQQVLTDFNNLSKGQSTELIEDSTQQNTQQNIQHVFEAQVVNHPDAIAGVFGEQQITYAELNAQANQLAHYLINECHIQADSLIGLCVERSLDMLISMLGILKAGGAYVPLDPSYPANRLAYMLEDTAVSVIISQTQLQARLPAHHAHVICIDNSETQSTLNNYPNDNPYVEQSPHHLAYVIYTSGSTGQPKGVMVQHNNVTSLVLNNHYVTLSKQTVMLQNASISFDAATFELWGALLNGGKLILPITQQQSMQALGDLIKAQSINTAWLTSGLFDQFVQHYTDPLLQLQYLLVGGDIVSATHIQQMQQRQPQLTLINGYGPTENTTFSTTYTIEKENLRHIPIGKPLNNRQCYILNPQHKPTPIGVCGELYLGGAGLARGYLNQPELTAERFIANPFNDSLNARLYKTGDLVRWLPDGNIEFLGRIDQQVKIRGFRIELGEIENAILSQEIPNTAINDTVVVAIDEPKRLVAYVVADSSKDATNESSFIDTLRESLSKQLPDYMVPSAFVMLNSLPLTANGKVDRKALPAPDMSQSQQCYVAPQTEIEEVLCEIWQEVLGVERVGVTDNFFHLGGHSLLVIQLIAKLQQQGYGANVRDVFSTNNLQALAQCIRCDEVVFQAPKNLISEHCQHITPELLPLVDLSQSDIDVICENIVGGVANIQDIYPLGPLQKGILFHHQLNPDNDPYVLPSLLRLKDKNQLTLFVDALKQVIARHDILRTAFLWEGLPTAVQVVQKDVNFVVESLHVDKSKPALEQLTQLVSPVGQSMDLTKAPLLSLGVLADDELNHSANTDENGCYLILKFHHLIFDHVGLEVITHEIEQLIKGGEQTLASVTPYREFIAQTLWQAESVDSEAYFTSLLGDVDEVTAPFGLLDIHGDGSEVSEANCLLEPQLAKNIRQACQQQGFSPAVLFHTAYAAMLSLTSGKQNVVFGTVLSGRLQGTKDAGQMLGLFINTLPIRIALTQANVQDTLLAVQSHLSDLLSHEQASLSLVQQCSGLPNGTSLFSAILNYRHSVEATNDQQQTLLELESIAGQERTNYPLAVMVDDLGEGFSLTAQIEGGIEATRVLAYMVEGITFLAESLLHHSVQPFDIQKLIPKQERLQLLNQFDNTVQQHPEDGCIHQLFEAQVKQQPHATAVVYEGEQLTYNELNQRANQLARYLIDKGQVKPDMLVGLCVERSLDMIVAILAILKAGGAYVPLDPDYPQSRLSYMLEDAELSFIITQAHLQTRLPDNQANGICLTICLSKGGYCEGIESYTTDNIVLTDLTPSHLAYVIYTSGSTGKPKGVMVSHHNVARLMVSASQHISADSSDVWSMFHSYAFDFSVWEIWGALTQGGKLVIVPYWGSRSADDFYRLLASEKVTVLNQTPSAFTALIHVEQAQPLLTSLRYIIFGGEALNDTSLTPWFDRYQEQSPKLINMYGITETTVHVTYRHVTPIAQQAYTQATASVIGRPLNDLHLVLLNEQQQLVPVGVAGEMYISGDGVTRGYLNQPALTAERFVKLPEFGEQRFYRSGDLARYLPNGELDYLGRIDQQVKIRGFRIELGEIEAALLSIENVIDAVVLAIDEPKRLVAYVVTDNKQGSDELLRAQLATQLPEHMVPSAFVLLDAIPLTANGKVDKKSLPAPDVDGSQQQYVAPTTDLQNLLCDIWQDVLGIEQVGIEDNFFHLGGHSLLALQLINSIQQHLSLDVSVRTAFEAPTISQLATEMENMVGGVTEMDEIMSVYKEIADLSDEEIAALLADE